VRKGQKLRGKKKEREKKKARDRKTKEKTGVFLDNGRFPFLFFFSS
jgi:hypothetical protein